MIPASAVERAACPSTLLDDYSIRLRLEHLWNADKCPALSREQRVERIRALSLAGAR